MREREEYMKGRWRERDELALASREREGEGRLTGQERGREARVWPVVGL
jgi:hypothetical protein